MTAQVGELTSMLRAMKLNAMANELERQFTERSYKEISFSDPIICGRGMRREIYKFFRYLRDIIFLM